MPNNTPRNPHFCSFYLFLIVLLMPFINKLDTSKDLTIFVISFRSLVILKTINVVTREAQFEGRLDPNIFL